MCDLYFITVLIDRQRVESKYNEIKMSFHISGGLL